MLKGIFFLKKTHFGYKYLAQHILNDECTQGKRLILSYFNVLAIDNDNNIRIFLFLGHPLRGLILVHFFCPTVVAALQPLAARQKLLAGFF